MRVLFITGEFPPMQGGVGDCTYETAKALGALSVEVGVLTSTKADGGKQKDEKSSLYPSIKSWDWLSLPRIARTIRDFNPDIVHLEFQTAAFGMHPAIYFLPYSLSRWERAGVRVRVAVTFHDLRPPYLFPKAGILREKITRYLARSCDAVITTNDEDFLKLETWDVKHLSLIPIGSNISTTPPADFNRNQWRAQLGVGATETLLCYFGFLNEAKGGETLIRALALVPNAKLLMIGGQIGASDVTNAAYLARVQDLIVELGLSERVEWTGFTPPEIVSANFIASDLCVMPYRQGASFRHGTLMAALAHGCAIVTTMPPSPLTKGGKGGLRDGDNCLLVSPDNPRTLADAIQRAINSPELRAKIGAGARELARDFTWDKIAHHHLELYRQILA